MAHLPRVSAWRRVRKPLTEAMFSRFSPYGQAVCWMLLSCASFATMWALIRLTSQTMHPFALVFWRNLIGSLLLVPIAWPQRRQLLQRDRLLRHLLRASSGVIATFGTFYAVANAPLAQVLGINYGAPLVATIGAIILLGEQVRARRIAALVIGFAGVLVVLRPGQLPFTPGIAAATVAMVSTAFSLLAIKRLSATEPSQQIVIYSFMLMVPPSLLIALPYLEAPTLDQVWKLLLLGVLAILGQTGTAHAFRLAEASAVLPFDFLRFVLVTLYAVLLFGEPFDLLTILGGLMIFCSTVYIAHREARVATRATPASVSRVPEA